MEEATNGKTRRAIRPELCQLLTPLINSDAVDATMIERMSEALLRDAMRERASDVHLEPESSGTRVRLRIDGVLYDAAILQAQQAKRIIRHFMTMANLDPVAIFQPVESRRKIAIGNQTLDVRLVFAPCVTGEKMNARLLDNTRVDASLESLGFNQGHLTQIQGWIENTGGMFIVTGPTGSGKTTTIYAILHELIKGNKAIVTIEDPVEYQIDGTTQIQVNEDHGLTFASSIKAMLRLDPDFIMIGEIRDAVSARAASDAAASGRVVLSTLHSRDAVSAITSLRSWGLNDHEILSSVNVIVAQRLARKLDEQSRKEEAPTQVEDTWLSSIGASVPKKTWHAVPTTEHPTGYHGRTGVFEVWQLGESEYDLILNHADERSIRKAMAEQGHKHLIIDGLEKAAAGVTSIEELRLRVGYDPRNPQVSKMYGNAAPGDTSSTTKKRKKKVRKKKAAAKSADASASAAAPTGAAASPAS